MGSHHIATTHSSMGGLNNSHFLIDICTGCSLSLSGDGRLLAVGGAVDDGGVGATWVFQYNGSHYIQIGQKLVGSGYVDWPQQGKAESLGGVFVLLRAVTEFLHILLSHQRQ